ncbi:structural maintenance of chromosomes protein 5-like isoform X1 [Clupea harengus]|uniref:Structural maintenance of chromosomes protein 5-like isoform X1 n=2 Tax=Clupea harengus TaxID=7950 RepID=A0A6P3WDV9_CLUHA|nr:structural maintenance of chromosomes protein 5-like isoform X1 [Clupea harengus]
MAGRRLGEEDAMKTRKQTLQEIRSSRPATRSQGLVEAVSSGIKAPARRRVSHAGTTSQSAKTPNGSKGQTRKRTRKTKSGREEPGIMRDLRAALRWMRSNNQRFRGQVTEPSVLQMVEEDQQEALKTALESDYPEAKDPFLFIFQFREDMDAFVDACADDQGLQISCMFLETVS